MNKSTLLLISAIILLAGCNSKNLENPEIKVLKGATMFDGNGETVDNSVIIIKEGKIQSISNQESDIPDNAEVIDLSGKFITPGLVDAHVHFSQTGFFDARPDVLDIRDTIDYAGLQAYLQNNPDRYYEAYLRSGVTAVYDVGGYLWSIKFQSTAENNRNAPHVAAAGPLLTHVADEFLVAINTPGQKQLMNLGSPEFGKQTVIQNTSLGSTGIKIWQINLNNPVFMESLSSVAAEVAISGNKLIVHATDLDQAKQALKLDAKVLVHSVDDQQIDDEFISLAKESKVIYCPTLIVNRGYYNAYKALKGDFTLVDPNNAVDAETKNLLLSAGKFFKYFPNPEGYADMLSSYKQRLQEIEKTMMENLKLLHEAGIPIAVSTDAGNPGTLHGIAIYDEMEAMQKAGISAVDIIVMATKNGAMVMDRLNDFGTLEMGKMADLIILENDPSQDITNMRSISHVMRGGLLRPVNEPFENTANNTYK
jgi:imidazolonepropionase-like amidohydrolase